MGPSETCESTCGDDASENFGSFAVSSLDPIMNPCDILSCRKGAGLTFPSKATSKARANRIMAGIEDVNRYPVIHTWSYNRRGRLIMI